MIRHLHISDYALIASLEIDFDRGLNIITGETGAGKSIILGALSLIMGERADTSKVRPGAKKTVVEAIFDLPVTSPVCAILAENDIDYEEDTLIMRREISTKGGSRAFINDTPAPVAVMREVAMLLFDIHSQHQNLLLANNRYQLSVIDAMADDASLLNEYKSLYDKYMVVLKTYTETRDTLRRLSADADFLTFQADQLDELDLKPGEQAELEREREMLSNIEGVKRHLDNATGALTDSDASVAASLMRAADALRHLEGVYPQARSLAERLDAVRVETNDIVDELVDYDRKLDADPQRLEFVDSRLASIYSLENKHHVSTSDELLELAQTLRHQLDIVENGEESLQKLEEQARLAKKEAVLKARELTARRQQAAGEFAHSLRERSMPLGMSNLQIDIAMTPVKLTATGADEIDFLFAFNRNQPLKPIGKTASGGEISRVMLALKSLVAERMALPTIIFDEVDTGVSGDVAVRMADLMLKIAGVVQVITITHLPAVAARGHRHFKVSKYDTEVATETRIEQLDNQQRINEIALMLSGNAEDDAALAAASKLLKRN